MSFCICWEYAEYLPFKPTMNCKLASLQTVCGKFIPSNIARVVVVLDDSLVMFHIFAAQLC